MSIIVLNIEARQYNININFAIEHATRISVIYFYRFLITTLHCHTSLNSAPWEKLAIPWEDLTSATVVNLFFILILKVLGISRARLFPRRFRASTHSANFGEARVTTQSTGRTFGRNPSRSLSADFFTAALRQPISARDRSPPTIIEVFCSAPIFRSTLALRRGRTSWSRQALAFSGVIRT